MHIENEGKWVLRNKWIKSEKFDKVELKLQVWDKASEKWAAENDDGERFSLEKQ